MITTHIFNGGEGIIELRLCNLSAWLLPATHHSLCSCCTSTGSKKGAGASHCQKLAQLLLAVYLLPISLSPFMAGGYFYGYSLDEEKSGKPPSGAGRQRATRLPGLEEPVRTWAADESTCIFPLASFQQWPSCCMLWKHRGNKWECQCPCTMC